MPRYPLPSFSYQGETKDLQVESLYQGEIKELGEKGDEKGRVGQGKWLWASSSRKAFRAGGSDSEQSLRMVALYILSVKQ